MNHDIDIFSILKRYNTMKTLLCYPATEVINDPFEQTKTRIFLNPLPVKGCVTVIGFSGLKWKYYGQIPTGSIQVLTELKYKSILLSADKIKYEDNFYTVYKDSSQGFQYLVKSDYCIFILSRKND